MAKSRYDTIKTVRELVKEVALNGISTREEDICRAQDIFGHSTIEELQELANNTNGIGGHGGIMYKTAFYTILFKIWAWEDAVKFWNETSNPEHGKLAEIREELELVYKKNKAFYEEIESLRAELKEAKDDLMKLKDARIDSVVALETKEKEILRLKAKLFDMMDAA